VGKENTQHKHSPSPTPAKKSSYGFPTAFGEIMGRGSGNPGASASPTKSGVSTKSNVYDMLSSGMYWNKKKKDE
jgi:hypothetical protein